ncbi:hypothetical protein SAICODRAFT_5270 [Saitoella complicata NRRL Y-17804]|nr:uncharacterized protein SAICODRAFT_5270 [Saitoella complicata NRRL Y-17804]ODQ55324.1 hypothetical protein SAICODRAFT_5270 [Saitoella complicata NRRL Y-17804]
MSSEILSLLDDLDTNDSSPATTPSTSNKPSRSSRPASGEDNENEEEIMDFLDEITAGRPGSTKPHNAPRDPAVKRDVTPPPRASSDEAREFIERARKSAEQRRSARATPAPVDVDVDAAAATDKPNSAIVQEAVDALEEVALESRSHDSVVPKQSSTGGWGWSSLGGIAALGGGLLNTAQKTVKQLQESEQARQWEERIRHEVASRVDVDRISQLSDEIRQKATAMPTLGEAFSTVLNVVAPPISEHEVLKVVVWHRMSGYPRLDTKVYEAFDRVMQQVEGGDLITKPGNPTPTTESRNLNIISGLDAAFEAAKSSIPSSTAEQDADNGNGEGPHISTIHLALIPTSFTPTPAFLGEDKQLAFLIYLHDPTHSLTFTTTSQPLPLSWVKYLEAEAKDAEEEVEKVHPDEWVEDWVEDSVGLGVGVVAERYVMARMGVDFREKVREGLGEERALGV